MTFTLYSHIILGPYQDLILSLSSITYPTHVMASATAQGPTPRLFDGAAFTNAVDAPSSELRLLPHRPPITQGNEIARLLSAISDRLDQIDQRLSDVERRLSGVERETRTLRDEVRAGFDRIETSLATTFRTGFFSFGVVDTWAAIY